MRAIAGTLGLIDRLSGFVGNLVSVLVPAMMLVICYEVMARYALNAPTIWAHDLSMFMFGYVGLLAGSYAQRKGRHIRVDVVYVRLSPRSKAWLDVIGSLLMFFFLGLVAAYGWDKAMEEFEIGARLSTEWAPPRGHLTMMIPVGAVFLILQGLADWLRSLHLAVTGRPIE